MENTTIDGLEKYAESAKTLGRRRRVRCWAAGEHPNQGVCVAGGGAGGAGEVGTTS